MVEAVAEAHEMDFSEHESIDQSLVNRLVGFVTGLTQRIIRLVRCEDEQIARFLQPAQGRHHSMEELKVRGGERGFHAPCGWVQDHRVQNAVAVEENGGAVHRADSHFISFARRRGWETMRCQTTAWNSSVWGVTVSGESVGMIRHASAT